MKLVVAGAGGRMGRTLIEMVLRSGDFELAAAIEAAGSPVIGKTAGELVGLPSPVRISREFSGGDCLIDFTRPEGTL
ncbi:MAG TPA: 4-hydroxy-tetrahydrodipicolinate reductase, partial [Mycobacterium sp.]|nr:4-hydroxy-tetrahydrodipicolinate reductase [Mycobacterium sp.]